MSLENARILLDRALTSPSGITVQLANEKQVRALRSSCYTARKQERRESTKIYGVDDPKAGRSAWDCLVLAMDIELCTLSIMPADAELLSMVIKDNATGEAIEV